MPTLAPSTTTGIDEISTSTRRAVLPGAPRDRADPLAPERLPDVGADLVADLRRRHEVLHRAAEGLRLRVPEEPLGAGVPSHDLAAEVHGHDRHRARLHERVRVLLLALDLAEEPGVVDGQHRLGGEGLERGDDLGREGAPLAPQDDEAAEQPVLPDERQSAGASACPRRARSARTWGATSCRSSSMSATSTGSRITPARPIAPSPSRIGAARRTSRCSGVMLVRGPRVEGLGGLVELVDDPAVAAGELDRAADDGRQHGVEVERGADGLADLAERPELADRARQIPRPRLELLEQADVLDGDDAPGRRRSSSSSTCRSGKGPTSDRADARSTPMGLPSRSIGTPRSAAVAAELAARAQRVARDPPGRPGSARSRGRGSPGRPRCRGPGGIGKALPDDSAALRAAVVSAATVEQLAVEPVDDRRTRPRTAAPRSRRWCRTPAGRRSASG